MSHANHSSHDHHDHNAVAAPVAANISGHDHAAMGHDAAASAPAAHHHHAHDHTMKMWFHGGYTEIILFDWWRINSPTGLLLSLLAIFVMGVAYEGVKWLRVYLETLAVAQQSRTRAFSARHSQHAERIPLEDAQEQPLKANGATRTEEVYASTVTRDAAAAKSSSLAKFVRALDVDTSSSFSAFRLLQTILYMAQLTLAYWLMLVAMTYNSYLTAAVVLGAGVGHWIFAVATPPTPSANNGQVDAFASDVCH